MMTGLSTVNLQGQVILVLGAGRGIGRMAVEMFANAGADLVIASRNDAELAELEYKIERGDATGRVLARATDATDAQGVHDLVDDAVNKFGRVDKVVYAAGVGILKPFAAIKASEFEQSMKVNVEGAFHLCQAVLPVMERQKSGHIIALPGILGRAPMAQAAVYAASKYALTGMLKCLALEYKRAGVRISLLHLGGVNSSFWDTVGMRVQRDRMLSVEAAARAVFFAATQEGEGVLGELVLQPESHQM